MEIYKILQEIMEKKQLSVSEVAKRCDLPDSTVRAIMTRKAKSVTLDVAFKLSKGLHLSLEKLNGDMENSTVSKVVKKEEIPRFEAILDRFGELTPQGQEKVLQYAEDLMDTSRYSRKQAMKLIARGGGIVEVDENIKQAILNAAEKAKKHPSKDRDLF